MIKPVYINAAHTISPQPTYENGFFDAELLREPKDFLQILAPPYKEFIPPKRLRRMTKLMRLGLVGVQKVLEQAPLKHFDGIIVGSGNGNISDTQKFLNAILDNKEQLLVPTSFVQSTPNIVSGSIALMLENKGYNMTYCHHNAAFENSLLDAIMLLQEPDYHHILVGGLDEITEENLEVRSGSNLWNREKTDPLSIFDHPLKGALTGESSAFFILSDELMESTYAEVVDTDSFHKNDAREIRKSINIFLNKNGMTASDIDLVLSGLNGVPAYDNPQIALIKELFPAIPIGAYKQFTGEHPTASAFGFWMAAQILNGAEIPAEVFHPESPEAPQEIKTVLIIQKDYLTGSSFALTLLRKVL